MADSVNTNVLFNGSLKHVVRLTNISDGTGEAAVVKVDKSTLTGPSGAEPGKFVIEAIEWAISGFINVALYFNHTTPDMLDVLVGSGYKDYREAGGLVDPKSAGGTGDITLTTTGAYSGAAYDITLFLRKKD